MFQNINKENVNLYWLQVVFYNRLCELDNVNWTRETPDGVKDDVARMIFYMATRYEGEDDEPRLRVNRFVAAEVKQSTFPLEVKCAIGMASI